MSADLGYNHLGQKGCKLLAQVDWDDLESLYLSKIWFRKQKIKYMTPEYHILWS